MNHNQLNLDIETPAHGRTLPIAGRPFELVMAEMMSENNGSTGRLVR